MGDSCSKMDHATEDTEDSPPRLPYATTAVNDDNDVDDDRRATMRKRRRSLRLSLQRVGSKIYKKNDMNAPNSPHRASNYNHVHAAVARNFESVSDRAGGERGGNKKGGVPLGVVGLRNMGNTCFMNSSLQCLSATIPLTDYFLGYDYRKEINMESVLGTQGRLVKAYAELMKALWLEHNTVVRPTGFKASLEQFAPQFLGSYQHDSQELLSFLLDGIHEDLNRIPRKPYIEDKDCDGTNDEQDAIDAWRNYLRRDKSLIVDIFQGQLRSTCTCLTCGYCNIRFEPFMYLSLPISDACRNLKDCLELYLAEDELNGENQWYCGRCRTHRDGTKKSDLWILPPILIVHLKRFKFNDFGEMTGSKNDAAIRYPVEHWDLSRYVRSRGGERPVYDLYAVSNHVGSLGGGHYTAYTLNRFDDEWYEFNDSRYRRVDGRTLRNNASSAYVLFYNRSVDNNDYNGGGSSTLHDRPPLIRRQSVSRPDLWPHMQVQDSNFRDFTRVSTRALLPPLTGNAGEPLPEETHLSELFMESTGDDVEVHIL